MSDIIRKLSAGETYSISDALFDVQTSIPTSVIQRAVVIEILDNLSARDYSDPDVLEELEANLINSEDLTIAPRNSIVVKLITKERSRANYRVGLFG